MRRERGERERVRILARDPDFSLSHVTRQNVAEAKG